MVKLAAPGTIQLANAAPNKRKHDATNPSDRPKKKQRNVTEKTINRGTNDIGNNRAGAHKRPLPNADKFIHHKDTVKLYKTGAGVSLPNKRALSNIGRGWYNDEVNQSNITTKPVTMIFQTVNATKSVRKEDWTANIVSNQKSYKTPGVKVDWASYGKWTEYSTLAARLDAGGSVEVAQEMLSFLDATGAYTPSRPYQLDTQRAMDVFLAITHIAEEGRTAGSAKHVRALLKAITNGNGAVTFRTLFRRDQGSFFSAIKSASAYRDEAHQITNAKTDYDDEFSDASDNEY